MIVTLLAGFMLGCLTIITAGLLIYTTKIQQMNRIKRNHEKEIKELKKKTRQEIREEIEQLERDEYKIEIRPNANIKDQIVEHTQREIKRQHIGRDKQVGITEIRIKERPDQHDNKEDWVIYYEATTKTDEWNV